MGARPKALPLAAIAVAPESPLPLASILDLRLREHLALDALTKGTESGGDLALLRTSAAVARALCAAGYGADELPTVAAVELSLRLDLPAGRRAATVRALLQLHDGQRMAATVRDYVRALDCARRARG
ncbi:MAG: hypothetical protein Q7U73_05030 [Rubrivivax sp.]|nr:hypothetical protein [Rubrivivax sp.]